MIFNVGRKGGGSEFYIPKYVMSGRMSTKGSPLSYDLNDLVLNTEKYKTLSFHQSGGITVGYVQLFVYDSDTSAILYQTVRGTGLTNTDVTVDVSNSNNIKISLKLGEMGDNWTGTYTFTLEDIKLV